jgi:hypothetical protein
VVVGEAQTKSERFDEKSKITYDFCRLLSGSLEL